MTTEGKMIVKHHKTGSMSWVEPETHKEIFAHCNNGGGTATPEAFEKTVRLLLLNHGIKEIKIIKVGK